MQFQRKLVINTLLNLGELVVLLREFPVLLEEVPADPVKELSVTCVEVEECLLLPKSGEDGTDMSTSTKNELLLSLLLPLVLSPLSFLLEVIKLTTFPKSP